MNRFQKEIYEIAELLFSNEKRIVETDSFILEIYKSDKIRLGPSWRKEIAKYLSEDQSFSFNMDVMDKLSNRTFNLLDLNTIKLRTLYMELLLIMDLDEKYQVDYSPDKILCSVSIAEVQK